MQPFRSMLFIGIAAMTGLAACSVSTEGGTSAGTSAAPSPGSAPSPDSMPATTTNASGTVTTTAPAGSQPPASNASAPPSSAGTSATSAPATTAAAPATSVPLRGVDADTIKLGVAPIDAEAVREQFGVELGNIPEGAIEALVEGTNAAGGVGGREIEVAIRPFLPVGTEPSETACRELIEDEEVYAVLGMFLGDGGLCVTETYATPYFSLFGLTDERRARSAAPFISMEGDALGASIDKLVDTGILDGRRVAVYYESDMGESVVNDDVIAALADAGIEVVSDAQLPSSGDAVQAANDIDVIFQRFEADGADALVVLSGAAVVLPALERTEWQPQLAFTNGQFTSDGGLGDFGLTDFSELEGSVAVTMSLLSDDIANDPEFQACLDTINEYTGAGVVPGDVYPLELNPDSREMGQLPGLCQLWDLTITTLNAVGDDLAPDTMSPALDRVGQFELPGYPIAEITDERWGAVDAVRRWDFDAATQSFVPSDG